MNTEVRLVTAAEAANRLGVSIVTLRKFIHEKQLASVLVGKRQRRISLVALEAFVAQGGVTPTPDLEGGRE